MEQFKVILVEVETLPSRIVRKLLCGEQSKFGAGLLKGIFFLFSRFWPERKGDIRP